MRLEPFMATLTKMSTPPRAPKSADPELQNHAALQNINVVNVVNVALPFTRADPRSQSRRPQAVNVVNVVNVGLPPFSLCQRGPRAPSETQRSDASKPQSLKAASLDNNNSFSKQSTFKACLTQANPSPARRVTRRRTQASPSPIAEHPRENHCCRQRPTSLFHKRDVLRDNGKSAKLNRHGGKQGGPSIDNCTEISADEIRALQNLHVSPSPRNVVSFCKLPPSIEIIIAAS